MRACLAPFLISRFLFFAIVLCVSTVTTGLFPDGRNEILQIHGYLDIPLSTFRLQQIFFGADAGWYLEIARDGYEHAPFTAEARKSWVYFPLFPAVVAFASFGGDNLLPALIVNQLFFLFGIAALYRLGVLVLGDDRARQAVWLICFFPTSIFFSVPMSEALFFLTLVASFCSLKENRPIAAGLWMMAAGLTRPTGIFLLPAFVLGVWEVHRKIDRRGVIAILLAPLGTLAFMAYLQLICGNPFAFFDNQLAWNRRTDLFSGWGRLWSELHIAVFQPGNFLPANVGAAILAAAAAVYWIRRKQFAYAGVIVIAIAAALATGTFLGTARYVVTLFPVFLAGAAWLTTAERERITLALFAGLFAVYSLMYAMRASIALM